MKGHQTDTWITPIIAIEDPHNVANGGMNWEVRFQLTLESMHELYIDKAIMWTVNQCKDKDEL